jgi:hypothetical protein
MHSKKTLWFSSLNCILAHICYAFGGDAMTTIHLFTFWRFRHLRDRWESLMTACSCGSDHSPYCLLNPANAALYDYISEEYRSQHDLLEELCTRECRRRGAFGHLPGCESNQNQISLDNMLFRWALRSTCTCDCDPNYPVRHNPQCVGYPLMVAVEAECLRNCGCTGNCPRRGVYCHLPHCPVYPFQQLMLEVEQEIRRKRQ